MKISKAQFRKLVLLEVMLLVVYVIGTFIDMTFLPEVFQNYLTAELESPYTPMDIGLSVLALAMLVWAVQNYYALYRFKSYAPKHYVLITLLGSLYYFATPLEPIVMTVAFSFVTDAWMLLTGFLIAVMFFTDLRLEFKKEIEQSSK